MSLGNTVDSSSSKMVNSERSRRKTMTLQLPLAALSAANVVDAKYDSDSDFDYRQKPPRLALLHSKLTDESRGGCRVYMVGISSLFLLRSITDLTINDVKSDRDAPVIRAALPMTMTTTKVYRLCQESAPLRRSWNFRPRRQYCEASERRQIGGISYDSSACFSTNPILCKNKASDAALAPTTIFDGCKPGSSAEL